MAYINISDLIARAADLIGDSEESNPEYFRAQVELIANSAAGNGHPSITDDTRYDHYATAVRRVIARNLSPTIDSIDGGSVGHIMLYPTDLPGGSQWVLYIPPTTLDAFEGGPAEADPLTSDVLAPWGTTHFETATEAVTFLRDFIIDGQLVANDGRVLT